MSYTNRQFSQRIPGDPAERPHWVHAFSQSFISGMQKCPEETRAKWAGEIPRTYTDSTALGESMHEGIQYLLLDKRDGGGAHGADLDTAIQVALHHLDGLEWKYTKISKAFMYERLPQMVGAFAEHVLPTVEPAQVELPFRVPLYRGRHRTIYVCGTMDCIDTDGEPWDWKSASSEHEVWEHQRWATQPTVYTYAAWAMGEGLHELELPAFWDPPNMGERLFHYGVVMHDASVQTYDVWRDQGHVQWLKQQCSQIAWLIEHNVKPWVLNDGGWWCSEKWCGKWDTCKGAHVPVEWKSKA